jgi:hypothetical protein
MINISVSRSAVAATAVTCTGVAALLGIMPSGVPEAAANAPAQLATPQKIAPLAATASVHNNAFYAVSCLEWTQCLAVGSRAAGKAVNFRPLAARWNGKHWAVVSMPDPSNRTRALATAISCRSAGHCVATGYHYGLSGGGYAPLAEFWNGKTWRIIQRLNPSTTNSAFLNDVSCRAAAGCLAVGGSAGPNGNGQAIAERWTGSKWRFSRVPEPSGALATELNGISCTGRVCLAVGEYEIASSRIMALAERWNGTSWHLLPAVSERKMVSELAGVSCHTATSCMAVGDAESSTGLRPMAELWQDGRWRLVSGGQVNDGVFSGVSCPDLKWCVAVGLEGERQLAEVWSGRQWRVVGSQRGPGRPADEFSSLSCGAKTIRCLTVGARYEPGQSSGEATLGEWWNGRSWRLMATPNP